MRAYIKDNTLFLSGDVTIESLQTNEYLNFTKLVQQEIDAINLQGLTQADSACVSLLLTTIRSRKNQEKPLAISSIPSGLRTLISLYQVDTWIH